jgi:broad specificity phosphatase PhoE
MPNLILIKHAQPIVVPENPPNTWQLSEEGYIAIRQFAPSVKEYTPKHIFSSPEDKAIETALALAEALHIGFEIVDNLYEHERSNEKFEDHDVFITKMKAFFAHPNELVYGSETANNARARFHIGLMNVWRKHRHHDVAVVAHGTVISLFVAHAIPTIDPFELWRCLKLPDMVVLHTDDFTDFTLIKGCN